MSLISTGRLAKSYGPDDIFDHVSVAIPRGGRIALVGPNGAGKTTLLRILVGIEEPSGGSVGRAKGLRVGYLPQESDWSGEGTLWAEMLAAFAALRAQEAELARLELALAHAGADAQHLRQPDGALAKYGSLQEKFELAGGYQYDTRIRTVLTGLGFEADDYQRPLAQLSGGQQTRAHLGRLLLESPELLILDEPTNHLDFAAVEWLEGWLADWGGAALVVSHDRYFMDRVADTIWEMQGGRVETYSGNYTAYLTQRTERRARQRLEYDAQREFIAKTEDYIRRNIAGQNTAQAKGRLRRLDRLKRNGLIERPRSARNMRLNLRARGRSGDRVLETKNLVIGYADDGQSLFHAPDLLLWRGECAALIGPNGAGKTTFLRTLLGDIPPLDGQVKLGASLHVGHFAQAHERLDPEHTVVEELWATQEMPVGQARDYLARFLFTGDDAAKRVAVLSGGERGRLALAKLALQGANFLLLDEPTNHLDIPSQEILESVLADFPGTILLVSHDRYLIDTLATQIWSLDDGQLSAFMGNYGEWARDKEAKANEAAGKRGTIDRRRRAASSRVNRGAGDKVQGASQPRGAVRGGSLSKTGQEIRQPGRQSRSRVSAARTPTTRAAELETLIASLERQLGTIGAELEAAGTDVERVRSLGEEYVRVESDLNAHIAEWTGLNDMIAPR